MLIACVVAVLFAGVVAVFVGGIFALTRPVVDASEQFLTLLGEGRIGDAYASTADDLRARQDESSFATAVARLGLTDFSSAAWHSRQIENQDGTAEGTVVTKSGEAKPVTVRLVREAGRWSVVGVRYGGIDLATVDAPPAPPPAAELEALVTDSLLEFNEAVRAADFVRFHGTLANVWKRQTSPQQLRATFQAFIDRQIDIGPIADVKPQLSAPAAVSEKGTLAVEGRYPTRPWQVRFGLEYTREGGRWRLTSIAVNVGKADTADR
jgi:hypothetical protein